MPSLYIPSVTHETHEMLYLAHARVRTVEFMPELSWVSMGTAANHIGVDPANPLDLLSSVISKCFSHTSEIHQTVSECFVPNDRLQIEIIPITLIQPSQWDRPAQVSKVLLRKTT